MEQKLTPALVALAILAGALLIAAVALFAATGSGLLALELWIPGILGALGVLALIAVLALGAVRR
jgi:hypothetical protein